MPLQFFAPAALWTLAALALPLALHLWRPPPRTVRLGSLRFLTDAPRPLRNLRWLEILLLCTRLGLLALLALLIAGPRWLRTPPAGPRRWALLDPAAMPAGASLARWRAVRAAGYEFHRLAPGLPTFASDATPPTGEPAAPASDAWSLLREADAALPAGSECVVFSPGRVAGLRGVRPVLGHLRVEWVQTPDAAGDAPRAWIAAAETTADASGRFVLGRSDAVATIFRSDVRGVSAAHVPVVAFRAGEFWRIKIAPVAGGKGGFSAQMLDHDGKPVRPGAWTFAGPAAAPLRVVILHDAARAEDARYLEAAVRAAGRSHGNPVNIETLTNDPPKDDLPLADWLFWLSARPVPEAVDSRAAHLLSDAPGGDAVTTAGWLVAPPDTAGAAALAEGVRLWKSATPSGYPAGSVYWTDGQGNPLLTRTVAGNGERWQFFSRFHPDWNDLPRTAVLAAWMRGLLFADGGSTPFATDPVNDLRLADPAQCLPSDAPASGVAVTVAAPTAVDLHWPVWLLAAVLFVAERILIHRRVADRASPATVAPTERELATAEP